MLWMKRSLVVLATVAVGLLTSAQADPPNQAILDGVPNEYDGTDLVGTRVESNFAWGAGTVITNLFVTWDTNYLYVSVQGWESGNKFGAFIDVDPDNGTGATRTEDLEDPTGSKGFPNWLRYQSPNWEASSNGPAFGLDYMFATEGFYNNALRIGYDGVETNAAVILASVDNLFDNGNGSTPQGTPVDVVVREKTSDCRLRGLEARIPWSTLYNTNKYGTVLGGDIVPIGASLRVLGHLWNNNTDAYSSEQTIPEQTSTNASYAGGLIITADYIDIPVDVSPADGIPDVAPGDVNAPYITTAAGAAGDAIVYLTYNEGLLNNADLTDPLNYLVGGVTATSITVLASNIVEVTASSDLPAEGTEVVVSSSNISDLSGNSKTSEACLTVSAPGILNPVDVTFVLETDSGMGTGLQYFVNSASFPLQEGMPPATNAPLTNVAGTVFSRTVTFPAGTPNPLEFRHSATYMGTNTYEVVTMDKFDTAGHLVELNDFGTPIVVTNWLGAAGPPARTGGPGTQGWMDVYQDPKRGDSGVRVDTPVKFRLALTGRNLTGVQRVLILGADPLRGFNNNDEDPAISDFPPNAALFLDWSNAGLDMTPVGGGIYELDWVAATDGIDPVVGGSPNSLVGGDYSTAPYEGDFFWIDQRTPRRITYKFYLVTSPTTAVEQVAGDNTLYIDSGEDGTSVESELFIWDAAFPPLSTGTDTALIVSVSNLTNPHTRVVYQNSAESQANNVEVGNLDTEVWANYGMRGDGDVFTGIWTADVELVNNDTEAYRIVTPGLTNLPQTAGLWTWWEPSFLDTNGGTVTVHYSQLDRALAGDRTVQWYGAFPDTEGWGSLPMTFEGDAQWSIEIAYGATNVNASTQTAGFKLADRESPGLDPESVYDGDQGDGGNNYRIQWQNRATVTPDPIQPGNPVTVVFDATGTDIEGASSANLWYGWVKGEDGGWDGAPGEPMSPAGPTNVWTVTLTSAPTDPDVRSLNFVFNGMVGTNQEWSSANQGDNPMDWKAYVAP